ncbi:MAG: TRAP transporter small permease [Pseudomonadota bacterium]
MTLLSPFRSILLAVGFIETALAVAVLTVIVSIILMQVFSRYVLGTPLIWVEELATYLLIWLAFLTASIALKLKRHITIRTYDSFVSERTKALAEALVYACATAALLAVILHVPDAMRTEMMQSTVGLPINVGKHWFFTVPVLVSCISMLTTCIFYALEAFLEAPRPLLVMPVDPSLADDLGLDEIPTTHSSNGGRR